MSAYTINTSVTTWAEDAAVALKSGTLDKKGLEDFASAASPDELKTLVGVLGSAVITGQDKLKTTEVENKDLKDELKTAEDKCNDLQSKLKTAESVHRNALHDAEAQKSKLEGELKTTEGKYNDLQSKLKTAESEYSDLQSKLKTAEEGQQIAKDRCYALELQLYDNNITPSAPTKSGSHSQPTKSGGSSQPTKSGGSSQPTKSGGSSQPTQSGGSLKEVTLYDDYYEAIGQITSILKCNERAAEELYKVRTELADRLATEGYKLL